MIGAIRTAQISSVEKQKRIQSYFEHPTICTHCASSLPYAKRKNKFCSHSCAASFNQLGKTKWFILVGCLECGIPFNRKGKRRCDKCWYKPGQKPFDSLKGDGPKKFRLLQERGHKCEICETFEWRGQLVPIELDHIDGNPDKGTKENLRLLCPNCHAQTPTYKNRNRHRINGSRRQQRRLKYI